MEVQGWGQLKVQNSKLRNNKMTNTEKPTTITEKKKNIVEKTKEKTDITPKEPIKKKEEKKAVGTPKEEKEKSEKKESKEEKKEKGKRKKTETIVNSYNLPISTKYSVAICKFIKNKKIQDAIKDLEQVLVKKKAVPMKGEIPHRKGKRMMSGRFPKKATEYFLKMLKSLSSNASTNELENPIITEAVANIGARPYGRFGRIRRKRTHLKIKAKEKKWKKEI